jgi:hypothetical protein
MPARKGRTRAGRKGFQPEVAAAKWQHWKDIMLFAFAILMTALISIGCVLIILHPAVPILIKPAAAGLLFFTSRTLLRHLTGTVKS